MKRKSCLNNLIIFYKQVTTLVDEESVVGFLHFDFSKAFDFFQSNLKDKPEKLSLDKWISRWTEKYLNSWDQKVVISITDYTWRPVVYLTNTRLDTRANAF